MSACNSSPGRSVFTMLIVAETALFFHLGNSFIANFDKQWRL
jgi:hypothetical protein